MTREQEAALDSLRDWYWHALRTGEYGPEFPPTPAEQAVVNAELVTFAGWCAALEVKRGRVLIGAPGWTSRLTPGPAPVTCFPKYRRVCA